jgi:superfamily II DNA or RNA helicase
VTAIRTVGFELVPWQLAAVAAWEEGGARPFTGTLEIFTGGGKTLMAIECLHRASMRSEDLKVAIVVPTEALARQWISVVRDRTDVADHEIGLLGAGGQDDFHGKRVLVVVLNTAAKVLPEMSAGTQPLMLIVDECHRAGAPTFSKVLDTRAEYRLGLSATPEREEIDDDGEPLLFDEQVVGRKLGRVVYRFTLRDSRRMGWLPKYELNHHGLELHEEESRRYEQISRRVDELGDELRELGGDTSRAQLFQRRGGDMGRAAKAYVAATSQRKDLLYRARERNRIAARLVLDALAAGPRRILLFHERVDEAVALHAEIQRALTELDGDGPAGRSVETRVRLEHSRLPVREREAALAAFRSGEADVLVSVKSLIEGIDVPDADVGISVASSSSVRQRVQALGRVLRRQFDRGADEAEKRAVMHLLYVADTVDDLIYAKEDWADLTGPDANRYWLWPLDPSEPPEPQPGPPRSPRPTEEQEWERLGEQPPEHPVVWEGVITGQEYSVDTLGTVTNSGGVVIANPQGVADMVTAVRGRPGGRFRVTPMYRLVLVANERSDDDEPAGIMVAGALEEPFAALEQVTTESAEALDDLVPGARYDGPADKGGGTYKLRQKAGGVIERKRGRESEFALVDDAPSPELGENARVVLRSWRSLFDRGITFNVNDRGDAWYTAEGERRFLAHVPGGFAWPE